MKILVTGANGQLGQEFQELAASHSAIDFYFFTRAELDIANAAAVAAVFSQVTPDYCINAAAYTAVDKAEQETEHAFNINAQGVKNIAEACELHRCKLVHISTDYVFNGEASLPYSETEATAPMGVYGASKLEGEVLCRAANPDAVIIRTAWVFSSYGNNFVKTMLRLMPSRQNLNVVADQHGCPTYAADLASAVIKIILSGKWASGIYHYSNAEPTTWAEVAIAIKVHCQFDCSVMRIPTEQYPTPAKRPKYSVLNTEKIRKTFEIEIRSWKYALIDCLQKLDCKV